MKLLQSDISEADRQRFWSKVDRRAVDECWLWQGTLNQHGYGIFSILGHGWRAHRVMYTLTVGDIPSGRCICHRCDVPACVNPAHLWVGSMRDNTQDAIRKGRLATGTRHGAYTHPECTVRGSGRWNARLTDEKVTEIRRSVYAGETQKAVAARFGVNKATIYYVVHRLTWTHVK